MDGVRCGRGRGLQTSLAQRRAIWPTVTASAARRRVSAQPGVTAGTHRLARAGGATGYSADGDSRGDTCACFSPFEH